MPRNVFLMAIVGLVSMVFSCGERAPDDAELTRQVNEGLRDRLTLQWVTDAIAKSPDDWIAGVQEVVDDSACNGPKDGSSCLLRVRMAEYLEGSTDRPATMREGWEYWNVEMRMPVQWRHRTLGRRRLVLSTPKHDEPDVHGNWIFVLDPTPEDVEKLRALLEQAV